MAILALFLALLLAAYLAVCARRWGVPEMVSDTYYQGAKGWFSAVMMVEAAGILAATLHTSHFSLPTLHSSLTPLTPLTPLIGSLGLILVALVPMYRHCDRCHWAHKAGAWLAAIGCLGWAVSVNPLPTMYCAILFIAHMIGSGRRKPWYVAEVLGFAAVLMTLMFEL